MIRALGMHLDIILLCSIISFMVGHEESMMLSMNFGEFSDEESEELVLFVCF